LKKVELRTAQSPLVSVIIPIYNRAELLYSAVESVVTQTYKNLEIIIIDDGSEEDIKEVSDSFNDRRIKYIRHDANRGVATARNTGLINSHGEFIAFLDSDDKYLPEKIETQIRIFRDSPDDVGLVYCGILEERKKRYVLRHPKFNWVFLMQQIMIRRDVLKKTGLFDPGFKTTEDWDFIIRLKQVCRFAGVSEPLVIKNSCSGSLSRNYLLLRSGLGLFLRKHYNELSRREKSHWFYRLGRYSFNSEYKTEGYKAFLKSFVFYPNISAFKKIVRLLPLALFFRLRGR